MSRMKKYLALLLAIVMITALVGCGETNGNDQSQNNTGNTTQDSNQGDGDQDNQTDSDQYRDYFSHLSSLFPHTGSQSSSQLSVSVPTC